MKTNDKFVLNTLFIVLCIGASEALATHPGYFMSALYLIAFFILVQAIVTFIRDHS